METTEPTTRQPSFYKACVTFHDIGLEIIISFHTINLIFTLFTPLPIHSF